MGPKTVSTAGDPLAETASDTHDDGRPLQVVWRRLVVVWPPSLAAVHDLDSRRSLTVGRHPSAEDHLTLAHATVSRTHVRLSSQSGPRSNVLEDLGSRNGTWVDGEPLTRPHVLRHNAVVRLGKVLAVFECGKLGRPHDDNEVSTAVMPGQSAAAIGMRYAIGRAGRDPSHALIIGETGTGKELVAAELHRLSGRTGALHTINAATLSASLIESQLFGHERGAFTGAQTARPGVFRSAHGGSLYLDEVGELPLDLQPKLLRVLQSGEVVPVGSTSTQFVDVRVIAATNRPVADEVEAGRFRRDLFARLALNLIELPALRERRADLLTWVTILLQGWSARRQQPACEPDMHADVVETLLLQPWAENLRGLDRLVHELAPSWQAGHQTRMADLPAWVSRSRETVASDRATAAKGSGPTREELLAALKTHDWVISAVARQFGRDRRQIYRWMDAHGIARDRGG